MDMNSNKIPIIGAVIVFILAEAYLFLANAGEINLMDIAESGFVNEIILPGAALLIFGAIFLTKIANKKGIPLPWTK